MNSLVTIVEQSENSTVLPVASILADIESGKTFKKLPRHVRSQYQATTDGDYIYVKGGEVLSEDFHQYLKDLERRKYRQSGHSFLHHFSNYENKVPAVLKYTEALAEYEMAKFLQARHFSTCGKWLNIPRPLYLLQGRDDLVQKILKALAPVLNRDEYSRSQQCIQQEGVGIYVYLQSSPPHRADDYLDKKSWYYLKDMYPAELEFGHAYKEWVYTLLFMLSQGVLPIHEGAVGLGSPLDKGNLCLSGGMADIGTCYLTSSATLSTYVERAFEMSVHSLVDLGETFFSLNSSESLEKLRMTIEDHFLSNQYLHSSLGKNFFDYLKKCFP